MAKYPDISRGLGRLTPTMWTRLMRMLKFFETNESTLSIMLGSSAGSKGVRKPYFLAKITEHVLITANKYRYSWSEVVIGNAEDTNKEGGLSGNRDSFADGAALNLCEINNTSSTVAPGVRVSGGSYPGSYSMRPIGEDSAGGTAEPVVVMFQMRESDPASAGTMRYYFCLANAHDGTCPET